MQPTNEWDRLELLNEFIDFLWDNVEWWNGEAGQFQDGCKIPESRIDDMNRSLWKRGTEAHIKPMQDF